MLRRPRPAAGGRARGFLRRDPGGLQDGPRGSVPGAVRHAEARGRCARVCRSMARVRVRRERRALEDADRRRRVRQPRRRAERLERRRAAGESLRRPRRRQVREDRPGLRALAAVSPGHVRSHAGRAHGRGGADERADRGGGGGARGGAVRIHL